MQELLKQVSGIMAVAMLLLLVPAAQAEVYKVVDEHGNVTYTDQPPDSDAQPLTLRGLSIISPQIPPPVPVREGAAGDAEVAEEQVSIRELIRRYRDFAIVSPTQEQSLWGTDSQVNVAWRSGTALMEGMTVTVYINGLPQPPTTQGSMAVGGLDRGEHIVYAELKDAQGRRIARTDTVTFFMKQGSQNFPSDQSQGS
jgi:hypothetical protein